jgi:hypothetical protein
MRRIVKLSLLGIAAGMSACKSADLSTPTEVLPYAGVRFINAVPDSAGAFGMDFRFVDQLESNAHFRIAFRNNPSAAGGVSSQIQYKGAREGSRHFRIFLDDTIQTIASTVVKDSTVALTQLHNYTAIMWGNGRSATTAPDAMRLSFWEEDVAAPAAGKVALRVVNATANALDVWAFASTAAVPALASTPTWDALAPYSRSTYVEVDSGNYVFQVRNDGAAAVLVANSTPILGTVATCGGATVTATNPSGCKTGEHADVDAIPGTKVAGSAVTGIVFPRSTASTRAPQGAAFQIPAISYMWDRRPARICDPYC